MTGLAVLGLVGVAVLGVVGLGLLVWGLVEGWRERDRAWKRRQYYEQLRIHRDAHHLARQLQCEAFRVRAEMLRHVVQRMDPPKRQRPGGRHG